MCFSFIHCHLNYANTAWASTYKSKLEELYHHQKHAKHIINFRDRFTHAQPILHNMNALTIFQINLFHIILFMFKCKKKIAPPISHNPFTPILENKYNNSSRGKLTKPFYRKKLTQFNIDYRGAHLWNELAHDNFLTPRFTAIIPQENEGIYIDVSWYRTMLLIFLVLINSLLPRVPFFLPSKNITFSMVIKRERGEFMGLPRIKLIVWIWHKNWNGFPVIRSSIFFEFFRFMYLTRPKNIP